MAKENIVNGFDFGALSITVNYVGKVDEKEWPHFLWSVVFKVDGGFWTIPYKCGLVHVEKVKGVLPIDTKINKKSLAYHEWEKRAFKPKAPINSDIMYSLLSDAAAADSSFNYWCADYGFDNDSISAFKTYQQCCEIGEKIRKYFKREQVDAMRAALEDY